MIVVTFSWRLSVQKLSSCKFVTKREAECLQQGILGVIVLGNFDYKNMAISPLLPPRHLNL